jgi:hypothetical protein
MAGLQHKFCYFEPLDQAHTQCVDGEIHRLHPMREVTAGGNADEVVVYSLWVEEDESHVADGIVVPCYHVKRAYSESEIVDYVKVLRPRV